MKRDYEPVTILVADDDPDDQLLIREAFEENRLISDLKTVKDGEELMDFLYRRGKFENSTITPKLILLDLNMPRKSGLDALREIRADEKLRSIPIVIITTSKSEGDIFRSYDLGVNSFIVKPTTFKALVELVKDLDKYWFEIVELPSTG